MSGIIEDENRRKLKEHVKELETTVKTLEKNIKDSANIDKQVMMSVQTDRVKYQGISNQLEEALKENQYLLNILQQKSEDQDSTRTNSQGDISRSCSTMSIVHLQYKYEELLANHNGLLKLLDHKTAETKRVYDENVHLKTEIEELKQNLSHFDEKYSKLLERFSKLKERKNKKIDKLKARKEALHVAHNQLVDVLHNQCMEKDNCIFNVIRKSGDSDKALLLQEIRRNNMLAYENFRLTQKLEFLRSIFRSEKRQRQCSKS